MAKELKPDTPVLLMQEETAEKNNLKVVKGLDKNGNPKGVDPNKAKQGDFLSIDKSSDLIENFFRNFLKQADNPKHLGVTRNLHKFYVVTYGMLKDALNMTSEQLEKFRVKPEEYVNQKNEEIKTGKDQQPEQKTGEETDKSKEQTMEQHSPKNEQPKQDFTQFDVSRISQSEFDKLGITAESVEKYMNQMSWGFKSKDLVDLNLKVGDTEIPVKARLSLTEQPDGSLNFKMYPYQEKVDVEKPFMGVILPEDVKENILTTGHSCKIVDLEPEPGKIVPALISVDLITNRLEAVPIENLSFKKILGTKVTPEQENDLKNGKEVHIENMISKKTGKNFDDTLYFNAATGKLAFSKFNPRIGEEQSQTQTPKQTHPDNLKAVQIGNVWVRPIQGGVPLTKDQFEKVCNKEAVFVQNMEKKPPKQEKEGAQQVEATDKKNQKYNAWVYIDPEKGYVRHTGKLPDHIKPAQDYETQVAINSHGKTNEATKHIQEPLKKGQTQPTGKQAENRQGQDSTKKVIKKNKGVIM